MIVCEYHRKSLNAVWGPKRQLVGTLLNLSHPGPRRPDNPAGNRANRLCRYPAAQVCSSAPGPAAVLSAVEFKTARLGDRLEPSIPRIQPRWRPSLFSFNTSRFPPPRSKDPCPARTLAISTRKGYHWAVAGRGRSPRSKINYPNDLSDLGAL